MNATALSPSDAASCGVGITGAHEEACKRRRLISWGYLAVLTLAVGAASIPGALERQDRNRCDRELASMLEAMEVAFVVVDDEMNIKHFTGGAEALFKCKAADVIGKPVLWMIPKEMQKDHLAAVAKWWSSTDVRARVMECEAQDFHGSRMMVRMKMKPVKPPGEDTWSIVVQVEPYCPEVRVELSRARGTDHGSSN